jgi:hypothetical protein
LGEIVECVTEAIHRHACAPGDDSASTLDTLASCEATIRPQLAIRRTGQDPRDARRLSAFVFTYNDAILNQLEETHPRQQEACVRTSAATRRRVLDAILAGEAVDQPRGEI